MKLYKVCPPLGTARPKWAGTMADARSERMAMMENHGIKRSAIEINSIDVPTSKQLLIEFLNSGEGGL